MEADRVGRRSRCPVGHHLEASAGRLAMYIAHWRADFVVSIPRELNSPTGARQNTKIPQGLGKIGCRGVSQAAPQFMEVTMFGSLHTFDCGPRLAVKRDFASGFGLSCLVCLSRVP